ncbi:hypothetical protein JCM7686_pAMI5p051 (plasmid) [Paracoccus aminophilus JCM 7686]|uniref:Uncharacterized protein n=1 Tax=Paracoccus aminophilus JCM 7686 TaxID=1367847 RepID=S5Y0U5_PARAH|nr:hypothetical protein JCM7686_pAMI5p051 [Paracoccus aminophilus JCM 7686]
MLGGGGCIQASDDDLKVLRRVAQKIGAILISDEVITSRLALGGLQSVARIIPDLTPSGAAPIWWIASPRPRPMPAPWRHV